MSEKFESAELQAVKEAMEAFMQRCDELIELIGEKRYLNPDERAKVQQRYRLLKDDLKEAAKNGTVSGKRLPKTRAEDCFYDPAVRRAAIDLRPATNSHPITSNWLSAVFEARSEFSYWLHNMDPER